MEPPGVAQHPERRSRRARSSSSRRRAGSASTTAERAEFLPGRPDRSTW